VVEQSHLFSLMKELNLSNYRELHHWTVENREEFWANTIHRLGVVFKTLPSEVVSFKKHSTSVSVESPGWLKGSKLNIADSCFLAPPTQTAIVFRDEADPQQRLRRVTFGELLALSNRIANGLVKAGFKIGDAIAIDMPMTMESVAIYLGIIKAGMVAVSIADSFPSMEIEKRLRISKAVAAFTVESFVRAGKKIQIYKKMMSAKAPKVIVIPADGPFASAPANLRDGDLVWSSFLSPNDQFESVACDPLAPTNVLFSSGTTGDPKAIPWTHLTPIKAAMDGYFHQDIHQGDTVCWPTNIGWMMGPWLIYQLMNKATIALFYGAPGGAKFGKFVQDAGVNMLGTIPTMVKSWLATRALDPFDWSSIRCFSSTGECSHPDEIFYLMNMTNFAAPVIEYCGGTEIGGGYITSTLIQDHAPSTFTTPALGLDFVVLGPNNQPVPLDEHGEVFLLPPSIGLSEHLMNRDHHNEYFKDTPADPSGQKRVLRRHGDEIHVLHHGYYQAMGRADDTMKLGGIKVGSAELERAMQVHKQVHEVAAVGVQSTVGQTALIAFVVPKPGFTPPAGFEKTLLSELQVLIRERLNPLFKLNDVIVVQSIPKTPTNKIMRRILRDQYVKSHAASTQQRAKL
jgi:acetyl-CoA synthetase